MHMIFQSQSSPILPLAYRAIFTNFYRVDFNNFCFFCAKQAYKKHVFENCICSCTFYYYILSKLLSNLALGHNYIKKSENTNWCQKASSVLFISWDIYSQYNILIRDGSEHMLARCSLGARVLCLVKTLFKSPLAHKQRS